MFRLIKGLFIFGISLSDAVVLYERVQVFLFLTSAFAQEVKCMKDLKMIIPLKSHQTTKLDYKIRPVNTP